MLSKRMQDALNAQINAELWSSYLYLSMAAYFESKDLPGFANWMRCQTKEEEMHAMKLFDYVNERGGRVILTAIDAPDTDWSSPTAVFETTYNHEIKVSGLINDLVNIAMEEKDHATTNFLQWFVAEQVEEEASANGVRQKLKLAGGEASGLFMLDQEMAQRAFTPPVKEE